MTPETAAAPAVEPAAAPAVDPLYERALKELKAPSRQGRFIPVFIMLGIAYWAGGAAAIGGAILVILVADAARYGAMRALDAYDAEALIFPFPLPPPKATTGARIGGAALAGIWTSVAMSAVAFALSALIAVPFVKEVGRMGVIYAVLAVLPLGSGDGSRLLNVTLFARSPKLQLGFGIAGAVVLAAFFVAGQTWWALVFPLLMVFGSVYRHKVSGVAEAFSLRAAEVGLQVEDEQARHLLYEEMMRVWGLGLRAQFAKQPDATARQAALNMRQVQMRASLRASTLGVTLIYLLAYVSAVIYLAAALLVLGVLTKGA